MKRLSLIYLSVVSLLTVMCLSTSSCGAGAYVTRVGMIWNTTYHITYRGPENLADSITATLERVGSAVNVFDSTSNLARINMGLTDSADVTLMKVVACAKKIYEHTHGAFDPTLGPAIRAWGFGKGHQATTDTIRLDSLAKIVGFDKWNITRGKVTRTNNVELNLSGIAKGYGCDAVAEMLSRNGVRDYMVEIGGEIRMGGESPKGGPWTIAIDKPVVSDTVMHEYLTTLDLTDCGMATSGDYRNFHTDSVGNRFGHTLDPGTLRPVRTDVLSATVIAATAMEADGYATACMVLGSNEAVAVADKYRLAVLLVTDNGVVLSKAMKKYIDKEQKVQ